MTHELSRLTLFLTDFDPYIYENEDHKLLILSYEMFDTLGLIERFKIPRSTLQVRPLYPSL